MLKGVQVEFHYFKLAEMTMTKDEIFRLTRKSTASGCAAKMGPGDLRKVLEKLDPIRDPRLLVGIEGADDAGVVRLSDEVALVQTVDFFTPIVDDPFQFGAIAAANALSDVYAMGGEPLAALNIVCFPSGDLDLDILTRIIQGGHSKVLEAGAIPAGGHSIIDKEIKYGLAVTGVVHPDRILSNDRARPGDQLVLTKPIGTGILSKALKDNAIGEDEFRPAIETMSALNRSAAEAMKRAGVLSATDVTGFGLLVHALEMACASKVGIEIDADRVPLIEGALEMAEKGMICGGTRRNLAHAKPNLDIPESLPEIMALVLSDAQTSGGLLIAVHPEKLAPLVSDLKEKGVKAAHIGEVVEDHPSRIKVRC